MKKRLAKVLILILCAVLVFGVFILPVLSRGKIAITIENRTERIFTDVMINTQKYDKEIKPGSSIVVKYDITQITGLVLHLTDDKTMISKVLLEYAEPSDYGTVKVIITDNLQNEVEMEVKRKVRY